VLALKLQNGKDVSNPIQRNTMQDETHSASKNGRQVGSPIVSILEPVLALSTRAGLPKRHS
jgi:hypothetical protein